MSMYLPTLFSVVPAQTFFHVTVPISIDEKLCQVQKPAKLLGSTIIVMTWYLFSMLQVNSMPVSTDAAIC